MSTELFQIAQALVDKAQGKGLAVMVTSTHPGEGKSLLARYIAWTAQIQLGQQVLLSEEKPHSRDIHSSFEQLAAIHSAESSLLEHSQTGEFAVLPKLSTPPPQRLDISTTGEFPILDPNAPFPHAPIDAFEAEFAGESQESEHPKALIVPTINRGISCLKLSRAGENPYIYLSRELPALREQYSLILVESSAFQEKRGAMFPGSLGALFDHILVVFQPHATSIEGIQKTLKGLRTLGEERCSVLLNHGGLRSHSGDGFDWGRALHKGRTEQLIELVWKRLRVWWSRRTWGPQAARPKEEHTQHPLEPRVSDASDVSDFPQDRGEV